MESNTAQPSPPRLYDGIPRDYFDEQIRNRVIRLCMILTFIEEGLATCDQPHHIARGLEVVDDALFSVAASARILPTGWQQRLHSDVER